MLARSFERIHRSNLIGMGILPLEFFPGESWQVWGVEGDEAIMWPDVATTRTTSANGRVPVTRDIEVSPGGVAVHPFAFDRVIMRGLALG